MGCLLNILWHFPFFGFIFALLYAIFGVIMCCTVILLPIGLAWFQIAKFMLAPFSSAMVSRSDYEMITGKKQNEAYAAFSLVIRILYFPFGCIAAFFSVFNIAFGFLSIVGIPIALVHTKLFKTYFNPIGKICVPKVVGDEIERRKSAEILNKYTGRNSNKPQCVPVVSSDAVSIVEDYFPKEERPQVRRFDDARLEEIVNNPDMYNAELVAQCRREIEIRVKSESLSEKVAGFDDGKLREIMSSVGVYADELIYSCEKEYDRRAQLRREEMERAQEQARIEREQEAAAERERRMLWWKKWRVPVCSAIALAVIAICAAVGISVHVKRERMRQEIFRLEQERRAEMDRKFQEEQRQLEEQQRKEREKQEAETRRREQQRQEAAEAKRRQAAEAEIVRKDMEERHKKGIYYIGEYYEAGNVRGIVFSTTDGGVHGMVISLEQGEDMSWNIAYGIGRPNNKLDWSLPTLVEMIDIMKQKAAINKALMSVGASVIEDKNYWIKDNRGDIVYYYSSDNRIRNCTKTDVRSQPYLMSARWVSKY